MNLCVDNSSVYPPRCNNSERWSVAVYPGGASSSFLKATVEVLPDGTIQRIKPQMNANQSRLKFDAVAILRQTVKDRKTLGAITINEQRLRIQDVIGRGKYYIRCRKL